MKEMAIRGASRVVHAERLRGANGTPATAVSAQVHSVTSVALYDCYNVQSLLQRLPLCMKGGGAAVDWCGVTPYCTCNILYNSKLRLQSGSVRGTHEEERKCVLPRVK
jgi:hypothetical protein